MAIERPKELEHLLQSAEKQGCAIVEVRWDPTGGIANTGWARIVVERGGVKAHNTGSGRIVGGRFEFLSRMSGPVAED